MEKLLNAKLNNIKGVGEKSAALFAKLGVDSLGALLRYYPRDYENWSKPALLKDAVPGEKITFRASITLQVSEHMIRRGMTLYKTAAVDENGDRIALTFFNNRYIKQQLVVGEEYIFSGKLSAGFSGREMSSPTFRKADGNERLIPIYSCTEGLTSRKIEQTVRKVIDSLGADLPDPIPLELRERFKLCSLRTALRMIHFPQNEEELFLARRRLIFEELLELQLGLLLMRGRKREQSAVVLQEDKSEEFFSLLPFEPTGAQKRAVADCIADMSKNESAMARLVQGDVGSGKTAVAAALCYCLAKQGVQSALMAPTEILAEQHAKTLSQMFKETDVTVALLTGSLGKSKKQKIYEALSSGEIDILIGTHALISEGVTFSNLGLVITDEQHRFGVGQRAALSSKGHNPHLLVMSATPIPRTLALMIFGDLDVSVLDEMPKGRLPVLTYHIGSDKRERAYAFIKKHIKEGKQAFVVCPMVEESNAELAAATEYYDRLRTFELADCNVGLLHGKQKASEKEDVMRRFAQGELDVLVSTTVVEVGVDVPNACVMLIENAERFGLSQLHQLRGRVGRGKEQAYCILVSDSKGETALARMNTMTSTNDGFEISNVDLKLRGPGDFFGSRQHGLPNLKIADLSSDIRIFKAAQDEAKRIIESDPSLSDPKHRLLKEQILRMFETAPTMS